MLKTINTNGTLKTTADAVTAVSFLNGGLAYKSDGALHVVVAGATLTNPFYVGGMAVTAEGALYITFDTPAASAVMNGGLLCRADGAVHVGVTSGYFVGGIPVSAIGTIYVDPKDSADLDLSNLTHSTTPVRGDVTPSMTRATTATIMGYAAAANAADGQTLLTVAANELRFGGARRISEGVWSNTFADGSPIPATTLLGPLIELASTNRCKYSEDFTNAVWVSGGGGIAVTPNSAVAPDGTTTADTLTASGANGTLIQDLGVVASAAKSGGLYLKRKTGTGNVDLTLNGGTNWTTQTINSTTWTRCDLSLTVADEDFGIRIVTSGDEVYAAKAMVATEGELTSYIANLAGGTATRNADQFYYTGTLIGTLKSLATVDFKRESGFANVGVVAAMSDATVANYMETYLGSATQFSFEGASSSVIRWGQAASNAYTPGTLSSAAFSAATNNIKMSKDGVTQTPDAVATIPTVNRLEIGMVAGAFQLNGYPGIIYGWTRLLSQSELNAITA